MSRFVHPFSNAQLDDPPISDFMAAPGLLQLFNSGLEIMFSVDIFPPTIGLSPLFPLPHLVSGSLLGVRGLFSLFVVCYILLWPYYWEQGLY